MEKMTGSMKLLSQRSSQFFLQQYKPKAKRLSRLSAIYSGFIWAIRARCSMAFDIFGLHCNKLLSGFNALGLRCDELLSGSIHMARAEIIFFRATIYFLARHDGAFRLFFFSRLLKREQFQVTSGLLDFGLRWYRSRRVWVRLQPMGPDEPLPP